MAINRSPQKIGFIILVASGLIVFLWNNPFTRLGYSTNYSRIQNPQSANLEVLVDKVYTFQQPNDSLTFDPLNLIEEYCYYITLEIVTPHNCEINATILDPENNVFKIFNTEVNISQNDGWFEIPFGAAMSGTYQLIFEILSEVNLNIHITLTKEHKCLHDIIPFNLLENLEFYEVKRFTTGMSISHNVKLKTDYSYRFYIERVSSIGGKLKDREIFTFFKITDPVQIEFQIYTNMSLVPIGEVLCFDFGTAIGGVYTFELTIICHVSCANIAYAIAEDYQISDIINGTNPPPEPQNNNSNPRALVILPLEFTIGILIICSVLVGATIIVVIRKQKKNSVKMKL